MWQISGPACRSAPLPKEAVQAWWRGARVSLSIPFVCPPLSLRPLSPLPQFRRPSMTQFGAAKRERAEGGWNVLKAETFLIVHSHRPYVTQTDHVTQLCSSRGKPRHYLRHSRSNLIMQAPRLHNSTQTDRQMERQGDRQTETRRETWRKKKTLGREKQMEAGGLERLRSQKETEKLFIYIT